MKKKSVLLMGPLLLAFCTIQAQQYNQEYIDSLIKSSVAPLISRNTKFTVAGFTGITAQFSKD